MFTRQMVVVTTTNWNAVSGRLWRFERADDKSPWKAAGGAVPVMVGRTGLAWGSGVHPAPGLRGPVKHEGDGKSPAGIFRLSAAFGSELPATMAAPKMPFRQLTPGVECVDDVKSVKYNSIVDREHAGTVDWNSSEKMLAVGRRYRLGVVVEHNTNPTEPGGGSCIFLHIWLNPETPTTGCTAMSDADMETLLPWLDPAMSPVLVQLPESEYQKLRPEWRLPNL